VASFFSPEGLANRSARHPWRVIATWVVLFLVGGFGASQISDVLTTEANFTNEPESIKAQNLVAERLRGEPARATELVIVRSESLTVDDAQFRSFVDDVLTKVRADTATVRSATSFYESNDAGLVSEDRHVTLLPVTLTSDIPEAPNEVEPLVKLVRDTNAANDPFEVLTYGQGSYGFANNEISEEDLQAGESIGIPAAFVILVLVFGAVLAAFIPVILAIVAITVALGAATALGQAFPLSFFVTNMITMIGLAVGIDYSLFIVARFREERRAGHDRVTAVTRTGATANKAVLFSGSAVVIALFGMLLIPSTIFRSLAVGAIFVVIFAVLAALTLLPAALSLLGDRVNWLKIPLVSRVQAAEASDRGFWANAARGVMAHPWVALGAGVLVLAGLSAFYFTISLGFNGADRLPEDTETYRAFSVIDEHFSAGLATATEIVIDAPNVNAADIQDRIAALQQTLAGDSIFGEPRVEVNEAGNLAVVSVPMQGDATAQPALDALERLRSQYIPAAFDGSAAQVYVGGYTAGSQDFFETVDRWTPIVIAVVLVLSFLILLVAFRSIIVPVKAVLMNLLSVGAAYGLLVLVFQEGVGASFFGFIETPKIDAWIPLFMFSVLFGLSMDYHVFLLSRIRERYDQTKDNTGSVAYGLRTTAAIITGAALIMVAVFGAFATSDLVAFQQVGFGLAVAVIIDATIVRVILVPAAMRLLGDRNWYFPTWLEWLPSVNIEGSPDRREAGFATSG
jgi:RND superfamily putative drug exporter